MLSLISRNYNSVQPQMGNDNEAAFPISRTIPDTENFIKELSALLMQPV